MSAKLRIRSAALALLVLGLLGAGWAQKETVLYNFCSQTECTDGSLPIGGVVFDHEGSLYGTTYLGGASGGGVVFKLSPEGKETVVHSFCSESNCADGEFPYAGVVFDEKGNLYGTTVGGGFGGYGVVFKLTPAGEYTVLHRFCSDNNCADGKWPLAPVVADHKGNVYGTAGQGGANNNGGLLFKVTPTGEYSVLYNFCAESNCADGSFPRAGVVLDENGNLFGTTDLDGSYGNGTAYKLTPGGEYTVLYSFCGDNSCLNGPSGVVLDRRGNLYGTAGGSGTHGTGLADFVFKLSPEGDETTLHQFCPDYTCEAYDSHGVVLDGAGSLYGTAYSGGPPGGGVVFRLTQAGKYTVLHSFCSDSNCADGKGPTADVFFDQEGNLYSTTSEGGAHGYGVVFKLTLCSRFCWE